MSELTAKQSELWSLADAQLRSIGGPGAITRNRDKSVRDAAKTVGTKQWALLEATKLASSNLDDVRCQEIINILLG